MPDRLNSLSDTAPQGPSRENSFGHTGDRPLGTTHRKAGVGNPHLQHDPSGDRVRREGGYGVIEEVKRHEGDNPFPLTLRSHDGHHEPSCCVSEGQGELDIAQR